MHDTGAVRAGTGANGTNGALVWTDPGNIASSNNLHAQAGTTSMTATQTRNLQATSFAFALPSGATVRGIGVEVEAQAAIVGAGPTWYLVRLLKAGVAVGDNRSAGASLTSSDATYSFGGATDLWGTTWSAPEINAGGFGCELQFTMQSDGETVESVYVDHVRITVFYTTDEGDARAAMTVVQSAA